MIKYQLLCDQDHEFEGWFSSSSAYDDQRAAGYVDCPICGSKEVRRALMAPNLNSPKSRKDPDLSSSQESDVPKSDIKAPSPLVAKNSTAEQAAMVGAAMNVLRDIHKKVKQDFTNVGDKFAEQARQMHYGEKDQAPIYGTTTDKERSELEEEGITFHHLPDLPSEH